MLDGSLGFEPTAAHPRNSVVRLQVGKFVKPPCPGGSASPAPTLNYTLAFTLQLRKNHGNISVRVVEKRLANQCWERFGVDLDIFLGGLDCSTDLSH